MENTNNKTDNTESSKSPKENKPRLLRSGIITSGFTFLSRILGLVRDIFIAQLLGAGLSADVFFFANRIPNFLRRLFAEGAFSQAFVPVLTEFKTNKSKEELNNLIASTTGTLAVLVFIVTVIGILGSSVITALFGWGWFMEFLNDTPDAHKFIQASFLLKLTFPYLFFITLTALCGGILNSFGKFAIPAVTPCLLNISMIASCVFLAPYLQQLTNMDPIWTDPNTALALGVTIGGFVQLLLQIPFIYKLGVLVKPKFNWHHEGVVKIRTLMLPALFGVSVSQINLLINTMLASFLATGAISYLYYSDRLLEFPIGIFAVAIGTVILPSLSRQHAKGEGEEFRNTFDWAVCLVLALGIPAMCGIIILKEPIIRVLFLHGEYGIKEAHATSLSLIASVSGLWSIMLNRVLVQGFYARQDTKTPVRYGIISVVSNIFFNLIIVLPLESLSDEFGGHYGYVGLALSTALAAVVNTVLLLRGLKVHNVYFMTSKTLKFISKLVFASIVMTLVIYALLYYFNLLTVEAWTNMGIVKSSLGLALFIAIGGLTYLVSLVAMRAVRFGRKMINY